MNIFLRIIIAFLLIGDMSNILAKNKIKSRESLVECDMSTPKPKRIQLALKHLEAGKSAMKRGSDTKALHHLERAIICNGNNDDFVRAEANSLRDTLLLRLSSVAEPNVDLAAADAAFQSGVKLSGSGDTVGAARAFARAVELHPSNALAWSNLGVVRQQASAHRHYLHPSVDLFSSPRFAHHAHSVDLSL